MEQDGKVDQAEKPQRATDTSTGKITLTLCTPPELDDASGYRHAIIPFQPSYEVSHVVGVHLTSSIPKD